MSEKKQNKKSTLGGFLPLKEFGKKDFIIRIFPDHANEIYGKIWKNGREQEGLKNDYAYRASIDLRLGKEVYISTNKEQKNLEKEDKFVSIEPGEFALLQSYEKVFIPKDMLGFIAVRYKYKRKGLVNVSGFHVDPGYEGHITFSVYNAGPNPVVLRHKDEVFTIFFATLTQEVDKSRCEVIGPGYGNVIPSSDIEEIKGPPISLPKLSQRLDKLETHMKILISLLIAIVGILLGAVLAPLLAPFFS